MKIKSNYAIRYKNIFYELLSIVVILSTCTVFMVNHLMISRLFSLAVLALICCTQLIKNNGVKLTSKQTLAVILYIIIYFTYMLLMNNGKLNCFNVLLFYYPIIFLIINNYQKSGEIDTFLNILVENSVLVATISLLLWIVLTQIGFNFPSQISYVEWNDGMMVKNYFNIYYMPQGKRNCFFFVEGPAYNYFLSTILLINEFMIDSKNKKRNNIVLLFTILSVATSTGLIVFGLFVSYKIFKYKSQKRMINFLKILLFIFTFIFLFIMIKNNLAQKLLSSSASVRLLKIQLEFEAFLESPVLGHGFNEYSAGSSNSITALLADGGIVLWGLYYAPLIIIFTRDFILRKKINYFIVIYTIMFAVSVFHYTVLATIVTILLWSRLISNKKIKKKVDKKWLKIMKF